MFEPIKETRAFKSLETEDLDIFFSELGELELNYIKWTGELPKLLVINPDIVGRLARVVGFYQRPELRAEVTISSPVVRYLKINEKILTLQEDWDEKFLHFE